MSPSQSAAGPRHCLHCGVLLEPDESVIVTFRERYAGRTSLAVLGEFTDERIAFAHEPCQQLELAHRD